MAYDKLSLASFKEALKEGDKYKSATGARRAVGKATTLSASDKDAARKLIDAHFGEDSSAKAAPSKKAPKAPKAAKTPKAPKAVKKVTAPAKAKKLGKRGPNKANRPAEQEHATATLSTHFGQLMGERTAINNVDFEDLASTGTQIRIAEKTITSISAALNAVTAAKDKFPDAELSPIAEEMSHTMMPALGIFRKVVEQVASRQAAATVRKVIKHTPETDTAKTDVMVNGTGGMRTKGEELFQESTPSADI